jgi:hypothetical protein
MKLKYTVLHAQLVTLQKVIEMDGGSATLSYNRLRVEMIPEGHDGSSIVINLPDNAVGVDVDSVIEIEFPGSLPAEQSDAQPEQIAVADVAPVGAVM